MKKSLGQPAPLGFSKQSNLSNFALFSRHADQVILGLFSPGKRTPNQEFPLTRTGDIWHVALENLPENTLYAFRCLGPYDEAKGHLFNTEHWHADPYSKILEVPHEWGSREKSFFSVASTPPPFDWQGVKPPRIPKEKLILYEMHVRGFTQHPSSNVQHPGTFLGLIEKIPYLKSLGINAVELLPVFEFDEVRCKDIQPQTGEPLPNYWGYNTLFFFAPMRRYAAAQDLFAPINEFKTMVRELHRNGIEVILDVVYNHTGEGKEKDYDVNFRGIDNASYYILSAGQYADYTGCGNTFNCNHPIVKDLILDSLRYWTEEMRVDGFRFDLASILTRDENGHPLENPPVILAISALKGVKLIAEAWDAAGLYQVGTFPKWGPWSDWNGKYRDTLRRFIKGTDDQTGALADALTGSQSLFKTTPQSSINFITAHDGYSLRDLVTYQMKHNYENGEMNRDGANQNDNWNCGAEGPTQDPQIAERRERQMRNFLLALFLSQGIPMLLMGDEYGHSRKGNNNPYVQDNDINWQLWNVLEKNEKLITFVSALIAFRKHSPHFQRTTVTTDQDIEWHGTLPNQPDWSPHSRTLAMTLKGKPSLYLAFNAHFHHVVFTLPPNKKWQLLLNTEHDWSENFLTTSGPILSQQIDLAPYTSILAREI